MAGLAEVRHRTLIASLALLTLAGCGPQVAANGGDHGCADRLARALTTPAYPIPGAYACMGPAMQAAARSSGITSDAGLQAVAGHDPAMTSYRTLGRTKAGSYVYELDGPTADQVVILGVEGGKVSSVDGLATEKVKR